MYALLVTVNFRGISDEIEPLLESYGRSLVTCPGYIDHVWMHDGSELAIFHLFEDEATCSNYLSSGLISTLTAHPACNGHAFVRRFRVLPGAEDEVRYRKQEAMAAAPVDVRQAGATPVPATR